MTGISVISYLYDKLKNNSGLTAIVGDRIFPIVAEENTLYPYLIMKIEGILPVYTKLRFDNHISYGLCQRL